MRVRKSKSALITVAALLFAWIFVSYVSVWGIPELFYGALRGAMPHKLGIKPAITIIQIVVLNAIAIKSKISQFIRNRTEETHMFLPISARTVTFIIWIALTLAVLATKFSMV